MDLVDRVRNAIGQARRHFQTSARDIPQALAREAPNYWGHQAAESLGRGPDLNLIVEVNSGTIRAIAVDPQFSSNNYWNARMDERYDPITRQGKTTDFFEHLPSSGEGHEMPGKLRAAREGEQVPVFDYTTTFGPDFETYTATVRPWDKDHAWVTLAGTNYHRTEIEFLSRLITEDPLTKVRNRRGFENRVIAAYDYTRRMARTQEEAVIGGGLHISRPEDEKTVIYVDIDHFKDINDTHGHAVGDQLLTHYAKIFSVNIRSSETVARFGGDEFAFVIDGGVDAAETFMERILSAVKSNPLQYNGRAIGTGISMGAHTLNPNLTLEDNLRRVDENLYAAKEAGRGKGYAGREFIHPIQPN